MAASACFMAAVADDRMPPHQPPPPPALLAAVLLCSVGSLFSDSWSSELVALGVKLAW